MSTGTHSSSLIWTRPSLSTRRSPKRLKPAMWSRSKWRTTAWRWLGAGSHWKRPLSLVAVNGDPADLVPPEDLPGDAYGEALWQALQRFRILALRHQVSSGVFPIISDDKLAEGLALIVPTHIQLTEESVASVEALAPPAEFQAGHDRILAYLRELVELRQSVLQAATAGDLETLRTYGELGGFAAERAETELWCAALSRSGRRSDRADHRDLLQAVRGGHCGPTLSSCLNALTTDSGDPGWAGRAMRAQFLSSAELGRVMSNRRRHSIQTRAIEDW